MISAASRVHVRAGGGRVTLCAEFAGLRRLPLILGGAMIAVALIVLGAFSAFAALGLLPAYGVALALLPLAPFLVIARMMLSHFRRRAAAELDALLNNLTMVAARDASPSAA